MNTPWTHIVLSLTLAIVCACDRKCQQPAEQPYKTFVDEKWRLVESTDPTMKSLSTTNFIIFTFSKEYTVSVFRVENNKEYQNPVLVGEYNVDPRQQLINVVFQPPASDPAEGDQSTQSTAATTKTQNQSAVQYAYSLGREFSLTDNQKGYYYRFVPYTGIVYPDNACTF